MPRSPRLNVPDLIYHVFSRGNNRENVFFEEKDYHRFLDNLERFSTSFHYDIYAYCILPNHFHLLLRTHSTSLSKIMQVLMTAYTMYANKKYQRVGHIFQGRFHSIVVEKETYLLQVFRYIHLNPVEAGLADAPENYPWSSYQFYLTEINRIPWLSYTEVLEMFSKDITKQIQLLKEFTIFEISGTFDPMKEQVRGVLGSNKFHQKLTKVWRGVGPWR